MPLRLLALLAHLIIAFPTLSVIPHSTNAMTEVVLGI
jgi:hypothetical protein